MVKPPWGINWQRYHADQQDMPHIAAMGYRAFTTYEWMWSNRDFADELLSVARPDALFLNRDHPKSEEKDDWWRSDPAGKGRAHADDWAQKVREGRVYTPLDRTFFLGLNEPDSNQYQRQIDAYNEAYCRRMAQHGLRAAAYSFGVGHPSTKDLRPDTLPDWSYYAASAAAVLEGGHIAAFHEYGAPYEYGWGYWCNRSQHCPYPFNVVLDECGIDHGVLKSGDLVGWMRSLKPEEYVTWLDNFQAGMAERAHTRKVKILAYNIFSFDHGSGKTKDWHSFDIRPLRGMIEDYPWREYVQPAEQPHNVYVPVVGEGPPPPPAQPDSSEPHALAYPVRGAVVTQRFGERPEVYAQYGAPGHNGLDIGAAQGTPVLAVASGEVAWVGVDASYGNYVRLWHPARGFHSFYAHLATATVQPGAHVQQGQGIGTVGSTGNSTGPHLHLEIRLGERDGYAAGQHGYGKGRIDPETAFALLGAI